MLPSFHSPHEIQPTRRRASIHSLAPSHPPAPIRALAAIRALGLALAVALPIAALASLPLAAQAPQEFTLTSSRVSVYNLAGAAEVVSHTGPDVVVQVRTAGADAGTLRVVVDLIAGRETLRVLYPDDDIRYSAGEGRRRTQFDVAPDGTFGGGGGGAGFFGFGRREVDVSTYRGGLEAWADLRVLVPAGRDVSVHVGLGDVAVDGVNGILRIDGRSSRVATNGTSGSLDVATGSGAIDVVSAQGAVDLDTGSGRIRVLGISGPSLSIDTGSGSVEGEDVTVETLDVDTGSGRVTLARIDSRDVRVDTGSGGITLAMVGAVGRVELETGSGGVDLYIPPDLGAQVSVSTGSGGIDTEIPIRLTTARRNRLEGTFGDGSGRIDVETGSGSVSIRAN